MDQEFLKGLVGLGGAALVVAGVQMFKPFVKDPRFYPFIAVALGLIINLVITWALTAAGVLTRLEWVGAVFQGVFVGLTAIGFYSTGETLKAGAPKSFPP